MLLVNRVHIQLLTHFMALFFGFLMFSVGINRNQLHEMGYYDHILIASQLKLTNENIKKLYLIFYAIRLMAKESKFRKHRKKAPYKALPCNVKARKQLHYAE